MIDADANTGILTPHNQTCIRFVKASAGRPNPSAASAATPVTAWSILAPHMSITASHSPAKLGGTTCAWLSCGKRELAGRGPYV